MAQESWKREEETGCQAPEGPILCTNNCGFFGSVATMNLCSKCYRELTVKQSSKAGTNMPVLGMSSIKGLHHLSSPSPSPSPSSSSSVVESAPTKHQQQQQQQKQEESQAAAMMSQLLDDAGISSTPTSKPVVQELAASSPAASSKSQTTNRCFSCRKRLGLTGFKCRCGDTFCSLHRYSDKHKCSYDYKAAARTAIAKANPVVKADKIEKI